MKKLIIISMVLLCIFPARLNAQFDSHAINCFPGGPPAAFCYDGAFLGGQCKPESIARYTSDPNAAFHVLIVYYELLNDPRDPNNALWPSGQAPTFMGELLSPTKRTNPNWWDAYDENAYRMSDYWMEVSRGKFHVIGQEVHVVLPHDNDWYIANGGSSQAQEDLYTALAANLNIYWPDYDQWSKDGSNFRYGPPLDGYVDMIYFIFRSGGTIFGISNASFNSCIHSGGHVIYNQGGQQIRILPALNEFGSGFQIGWPGNKIYTVSFIPAEHGHYLLGIRDFGWLGGHQSYGKVNNYNGYEEFLSPYELIRLGYFTTQHVNYSTGTDYPINDWTSRDANSYSQILEVPIGDANRNEFFLIANRQKVSTYDKIMWGDTAHDEAYRNINPDYGKGVYIYHAYPGYIPGGNHYEWQIPFDQECADGLFNWVQDGTRHPDWSCVQNVEYYKKTDVVYNSNDNGGDPWGGLGNHDGKSLYNWFGLGKTVACGTYLDGTDRIYTNDQDVWTSREWKGDRYDAWKVDYNQVFSPYSSPSTRDWDNNNSQIFIYLASQDRTTANFKIYKVGEGGYTEDMILQETPPSKPMLYRKIEIFNCNGAYGNPRVIWDNNLEPDMLRSGGFKRYKIYRAVTYSQLAPWNYLYVGTYDDYTPINDTANFIDPNVRIYCNLPDPPQNDGYYRYKIVAVDKYDWESVKSDFLAIKANVNAPDRLILPITPTIFSLEQNYPNPFNPVTEIRYSIPHEIKVSLKIYNLLGEEVADVVNEYKEPGYYTATFDGTNLASGTYFYKLEAGIFVDTKKMVLIK